jgi:hypothetical protein
MARRAHYASLVILAFTLPHRLDGERAGGKRLQEVLLRPRQVDPRGPVRRLKHGDVHTRCTWLLPDVAAGHGAPAWRRGHFNGSRRSAAGGRPSGGRGASSALAGWGCWGWISRSLLPECRPVAPGSGGQRAVRSAMAAIRPAEPVDPALLLQAFLIVSGGYGQDEPDEPRRLTEGEAAALLDRISGDLGTSPQVTMALFRRCCALANFLSVAGNRELIGVDDEARPQPAVWAAAASVPVHQVALDTTWSATPSSRASSKRQSGDGRIDGGLARGWAPIGAAARAAGAAAQPQGMAWRRPARSSLTRSPAAGVGGSPAGPCCRNAGSAPGFRAGRVRPWPAARPGTSRDRRYPICYRTR